MWTLYDLTDEISRYKQIYNNCVDLTFEYRCLVFACCFVVAQCTKCLSVYASYYLKCIYILQCFNNISNNETDVTSKLIFFAPLQHKFLTCADVLRCYGMTMFVDIRLARFSNTNYTNTTVCYHISRFLEYLRMIFKHAATIVPRLANDIML